MHAIVCAKILSVVISHWNIYIHFNKTIFLCVVNRNEKYSSCHMVLKMVEELSANGGTCYCVKVSYGDNCINGYICKCINI